MLGLSDMKYLFKHIVRTLGGSCILKHFFAGTFLLHLKHANNVRRKKNKKVLFVMDFALTSNNALQVFGTFCPQTIACE